MPEIKATEVAPRETIGEWHLVSSEGVMVAEINAEHEEILRDMTTAILRAVGVGYRLTMLKEQKKRQNPAFKWLDYVRENFVFNERQSQNYMAAYRHREKIRTSGADFRGLHSALEYLAEQRKLEKKLAAGRDGAVIEEPDGHHANGAPPALTEGDGIALLNKEIARQRHHAREAWRIFRALAQVHGEGRILEQLRFRLPDEPDGDE